MESTAKPPIAQSCLISRGPTVSQVVSAVVRRDVRAALLGTAGRAGPGESRSVLFRATAALYAVLAEHAPDRRGRCARCRCPGSWVGRPRRRCRVYPLVLEWLQVPPTLLVARLRRDFGLPLSPARRSDSPIPRPGLSILGRTPPPPTAPAEEGPPICPRADLSTPVVSPVIPSSSPAGWCPPGETTGPPNPRCDQTGPPHPCSHRGPHTPPAPGAAPTAGGLPCLW